MAEEWFKGSLVIFGCLCAYLALLGCILCGACRGAAKARKRRKQNEFELQTFKQAAAEAGHPIEEGEELD